jgi:ABC-type sugar transport system ATPase subunit
MDYPTFLLEARSIAKSFGPTNVLKGANLSIAPWEIHALLGGNGGGKSTLIKIGSGQPKPTAAHCVSGRVRPTRQVRPPTPGRPFQWCTRSSRCCRT